MKTRFGQGIGKATDTAARLRIARAARSHVEPTGVDAAWQTRRIPQRDPDIDYAAKGFRREWDRQLMRWHRMGNLSVD